jgi:hypothetical protein
MSGIPKLSMTPSLVGHWTEQGEAIIVRMDRWLGFMRVPALRLISERMLLGLVDRLNTISGRLEWARSAQPPLIEFGRSASAASKIVTFVVHDSGGVGQISCDRRSAILERANTDPRLTGPDQPPNPDCFWMKRGNPGVTADQFVPCPNFVDCYASPNRECVLRARVASRHLDQCQIPNCTVCARRAKLTEA